MSDFDPEQWLFFGSDDVRQCGPPQHVNMRCTVGPPLDHRGFPHTPPENVTEIAGWKELGIDWEEPVVDPPKGILHIDGKQMPGEITISDFRFMPLTDDMIKESIQGFADYIKREEEDNNE